MSYERLLQEHDRIDRALARLQKLNDATVPDVPAISCALAALSAELTDHHTREDGFIYPRMIASAAGNLSSIAQRFLDELDPLAKDLQTYLVKWLPEGIAGDWDGFKRDTEAMIARLSARIHAENTVLYTAALGHGLIRLRA